MRYKSSQTKLIHGALCFFSVRSIPGDLHDNKDIFLNLLAHVMAASVSYVWQQIFTSLPLSLSIFAYVCICRHRYNIHDAFICIHGSRTKSPCCDEVAISHMNNSKYSVDPAILILSYRCHQQKIFREEKNWTKYFLETNSWVTEWFMTDLLMWANGQQCCVFSVDLERRWRNTETCFALHCSRISSTCWELTPVIRLLCRVCVHFNFTDTTGECLSCCSPTWLDLWFHCHPPVWTVSPWAGHPELSVVNSRYANSRTTGTDSPGLFSHPAEVICPCLCVYRLRAFMVNTTVA